MLNYKYIVVGAGIYGSVIANRIASVLNEDVLLIEKRDHIGGELLFPDRRGNGNRISLLRVPYFSYLG